MNTEQIKKALYALTNDALELEASDTAKIICELLKITHDLVIALEEATTPTPSE